jgi:hypothetical protein
MKNMKTQETNAKRIKKLVELGFSIEDEKNEIMHISLSIICGGVVSKRDVIIDFSAIDECNFTQYAFTEIFCEGVLAGKNHIRREFRSLMEEEGWRE